MKPFNEVLRKCIEQSKYTIYSISSVSKVNRTTLQRALNGERTLSYENMQKLLPFLQLSPQQLQELKKAFIRTQLGENRFQKDNLIWKLLTQSEYSLRPLLYFSNFENIALPIDLFHTQLVTGSYNIINLICQIITQNIKCDKEPFLYSLSHFQNDFFRDIYHQLEAACFRTLDFKHIVPFMQAGSYKSSVKSFKNTLNSSLASSIFLLSLVFKASSNFCSSRSTILRSLPRLSSYKRSPLSRRSLFSSFSLG